MPLSRAAWISPSEIVFARYLAVLVKDLVSGLEDTLNPEMDARWFHHPAVTADSSILFAGTYFGIRAVDLATREMLPSLEMNDGYLFGVTSNGYILYQPGDLPTVWARKFNTDTRVYEGQGFVLFSTMGVAVSRAGHIIYKPQVGPATSLPIDHTLWDTSQEDDTILVAAPDGSVKTRSRWNVVLNWASTLER